ncbi:MAG: IS1634 family transposase, partial [Clostridiales bacterium]|nr:IS1634 family transposase [Clostridiales bacterium]
YNAKKTIEDELYSIENKLFPPSDNVVFHYDLTNTYFEGRALRNTYGKHGKSKEKRTDCPLMSLSLAVRNDGFPVYSCIYPGNQPEPITLKDMIKNVEALIAGPNAYDNQKTMFRPTFIMDRGIATKENVALLQYEKFNYVVVKREDETKNYKDLFKNGRKTFDVVSEGHVSAYGDLNKVYVKKLEPVNNERFCKVLCISDGKAQKQIAIITKKDSKLIKDFEDLNQAIKKGRIKNIDKIQARIGRIKARHKKSSEKYEVSLVIENEKALYVTWAKKPYYSCDESIYGRYVIETTFTKLDAIQIWILYMKQTIVERTFRTMKHDLHIRPVFHQTKDRSSAHIFVTLLAYHLVITILNTLSEQGDKRSWATLRDILFTHCRVSLFHEDKVKGKAVNIRKSGVPEEEHLEIYKKLGITDYLKDVETVEYLD